MTDMKVWVGCLGCYNAGYLVGEWVALDEAESVTVERITGLIAANFGPEAAEQATAEHDGTWHPQASPHEELWCMDLENTAPFITDECSPMHAQRVGEQLASLDDDELEMLRVYVEGVGAGYWSDPDWAEIAVEARDKFMGRAASLAEWAEDFAEETGLFTAYTVRDHMYRERKLTDDDAMSVILRNIDWEGVAQEWTEGCTTVEHDGEVWLFSS